MTAIPEVEVQGRTAQWPDSTRPSLTFLPAKIRGARVRQKAIRETMLGASALLLITAGAFSVVAMGTSAAAGDLKDERAAGAVHTQYLAENTPFTNYYNGFGERKAAVAEALNQDTSHSKIFKSINDANTVGAVFTSMAKEDETGVCPRGDLFTPTMSVGCVTIAGYTNNIEDVGRLTAAIGASKQLLTDPYLTESASGEGRATFKLTVSYTEKAFSLKGNAFLPPDEAAASSVPAAPNEKVTP